MEVQVVSKLPRLDTSITFSNSDLEGCQHPHDDPLVIRAVVANKTVHRVVVDNGSSTDIIFASAFDKMGIGSEKLEPVSTHLRGFSGEKVLPLGSIQLVLTLGDPPMPGNDDSEIPRCRRPIRLQYVVGQTLFQCNKGHSLRLPHDDQVSYHKRSRNGSRRPTRSQGMLLNIHEAKNGR